MLSDLIKIRKHLHKFPELSEHEKHTSEYLISFLLENTNAVIIDKIAGYGFIAVFEFSKDGPVVLFRCDMDAVPILEKNSFDHCSVFNKVSHMCGHDGHMAIMAGFALKLNKAENLTGKAVLLFQPAEENAVGAKAVIDDEQFSDIKPDYVFALHNLPGYKKNTIIIKEGLFTPSVLSIYFKFTGKTSHAAQPEKGLNPTFAVSEIIQNIKKLSVPDKTKENYNVITPVYVLIGNKDYGISPGYGELHYTIRANSMIEIEYLKNRMIDTVLDRCKVHNLSAEFDTFEYFPSVKNDSEPFQVVMQAAEESGMDIINESISFGEDFGWFTNNYNGALLGLGSGEHTPALHNDIYEFPDDIIEAGISVFEKIEKIISDKYNKWIK
jgi:amidohydrolase